MVEHTKEPWLLDGESRHEKTGALLGVYFKHPDGGRVGMVFSNCLADDDTCKENARRIVACVNACAGIPTYQLFGVSDAPINLGEIIDHIRGQRDELLAALKRVVALSDRKHDAWDIAHAIIAKVEAK